jgi:GTPase SAR1 family protein
LFQTSHPTTLCQQSKEMSLKGGRVRFTIWDCGGQEAEDGLRSATRNLVLSQADVLLLCYSMADPSSLLGIASTWLTELRLCASPATPLLLVGCKSDRREVEREQVGLVASQISAVEVLETSAKLSERSVKLLFEAAFSASRRRHSSVVPSVVSPPSVVKRRSQSASRDLMSTTRVSPVLLVNAGMGDSPTLSKTSSLGSVRSKSSTLSSTKSDSSMISISTSRTPRVRRRGEVKGEEKERGEKTVRIRCGRLNSERVYEEVEIEIPLSVYNNMQTESPAMSSRNSAERKSLANRLKSLFIQ